MKIPITLFLTLVGTGFAGLCEDKFGSEKALVIHCIFYFVFLSNSFQVILQKNLIENKLRLIFRGKIALTSFL